MSKATRRRSGRQRVARALSVGILGIAGVLVAVGSGATPAGAAGTFTVTTTVDEVNTGGTSCVSAHGCSLRAAVQAATAAGGGTIDLQSDQTYVLTAALGTLNFGTNPGESYTVNGNGSTVSAQQPASCSTTCFGVLSLDAPTVGGQSYTIDDLTVSGGEVDSVGGAGVLAGGTGDTYTFSDDTFSDNAIIAPVVGGEADGAGLSIGAASTVSVTGCTFTGNTSAAGANGGGLFLGALDGDAMTATVTGSTFTDNTVADPTGGGGGLYASAEATASTFTVTGDTFTGNQATGGGGVADGGGAVLVDGSGTLDAYSDNFLANSVTGSGSGGGVNVVSGQANLAGDRFSANTATAATGSALSADTANAPVVAAGDNWWSSNTGPSTADLSGVAVPATYLVLRVSASPSPVLAGSTATVTADLTHDQADTPFTAHPIPNGTPVTFGGTAGTYPGGTSATTTGGQATAALTAGAGGSYTPKGVSATVDGVEADAALVVDQQPAVTSAASASFHAGTPGSFTVTTTGYPAPSLSDGGATLPADVTFTDNGNGTATLAGTPAAGTGGTYPFTITAHNGIGTDATQSFTLTVDEAPSITSAASTTFTVGTAGTFAVTTGHDFPRHHPVRRGGHAAGRRHLHRQRQRDRHPGRHPGGRHRGDLPVHHHRPQRHRHRRHPVLHPDGGRGAVHHQRRLHHLHGGDGRDLRRHHRPRLPGRRRPVRRRGHPARRGAPSPTTATGPPPWPAPRPPAPGGPTRSPSPPTTATLPDATQSFTLTVDEAAVHHQRRLHHLHGGDGRDLRRHHRPRLPGRRRPVRRRGHPARRGALHRQRQRDRHPGRHPGRRHRGDLPVHHHRPQRHPPRRHPVLHPDGGRGAVHHQRRLHHLHGGDGRDLRRHHRPRLPGRRRPVRRRGHPARRGAPSPTTATGPPPWPAPRPPAPGGPTRSPSPPTTAPSPTPPSPSP